MTDIPRRPITILNLDCCNYKCKLHMRYTVVMYRYIQEEWDWKRAGSHAYYRYYCIEVLPFDVRHVMVRVPIPLFLYLYNMVHICTRFVIMGAVCTRICYIKCNCTYITLQHLYPLGMYVSQKHTVIDH